MTIVVTPPEEVVVEVIEENPQVVLQTPSDIVVDVIEPEAISVVVNEENNTVEVQQPSPVSVTVSMVGLQGPAGVGIPIGGLTGQVLLKLSNTDYDTGWLDLDMFANYKTQEVDEAGSTTYIGKKNARSGAWLVERLVETAPDATIRYANESNNGAYVTFSAAWAARASLTYAEINTLTGI